MLPRYIIQTHSGSLVSCYYAFRYMNYHIGMHVVYILNLNSEAENMFYDEQKWELSKSEKAKIWRWVCETAKVLMAHRQ